MKSLLGFIVMFHAGYSIYECRQHRLETNSQDTHIPIDVIKTHYLESL